MAQKHNFIAIHIDEAAPDKEEAVHKIISSPDLGVKTRMCFHQQGHEGGVIVVEMCCDKKDTVEAAIDQILKKVGELGLKAKRVTFTHV